MFNIGALDSPLLGLDPNSDEERHPVALSSGFSFNQELQELQELQSVPFRRCPLPEVLLVFPPAVGFSSYP